MPQSPLREVVRAHGVVPLTWAAATQLQSHVNLGDALSPVMVALLSGLPVQHSNMDAETVRMAAVGTIGHGLHRGDVTVWGTGASRFANPHVEQASERLPFVPDPDTIYRLAATRGPVSRGLFGADDAAGAPVYGDPVWLLPRFHPAPAEKTCDLGVIVHLSDLKDRELDTAPKDELLRYAIPDEFKDSVRIIHTVTAMTAEALRERLDEILSCRRIVSTSLHGMVFAESYGIPCLYFAPRGRPNGLVARPLDPNDGYDLRITDLYQGLGRSSIPVYVQPRQTPTDWAALMDAIDTAWEPTPFDADPLLEAFPLDLAPLAPAAGGSVFDHPIIRELPYQHPPEPPPKPRRSAASGFARIARLLRRSPERETHGS